MLYRQTKNYSYTALRKAVGIIGLLLPFVLMLGVLIIGEDIPSSISRFYHTPMSGIFTGSLAAVGFFLFFYDGYTQRESKIMDFAAACAIGIAIFPTNDPSESVGFIGTLHYIFSAMFFITLGLVSIFQFTKSNVTVRKHTMKYKRNLLYKISGVVILSSVLIIGVSALANLNDYITLIFEIIALIAFGTSWLVKGGALLSEVKEGVTKKKYTITLDFDGTCLTKSEDGIGVDIGAAKVLRELVDNGHRLILSTMRSNSQESFDTFGVRNGLNQAELWFRRNNIELFAIQTNPEQKSWTTSNKVFSDMIIDDTCLNIPLKTDLSISDKEFVDWEELRKIFKRNDLILVV